jgi:Predicted membrane protein
MALGAALHVQYVLSALPPAIRPLAGTPAVYAIVTIAAIGTWVSLDLLVTSAYIAQILAGVGAVAALIAIAGVIAINPTSLRVTVSIIGIGVSVILSGGVWVMLTRIVPKTQLTAPMGTFAVFGHTLDGVSTTLALTCLDSENEHHCQRLSLNLLLDFQPTRLLDLDGYLLWLNY